MSGFQDALAKWLPDHAWIEQTLQRARTKELVTLDIFDTCVTRDVDSPVDIFARVEKFLLLENKHAAGFAAAREEAEIAARQLAFETRQFEEVTLDEIYAQLPRFIAFSTEQAELARATELKVEQQSLFAVSDLVVLTQKLHEAGIAYCFVSDMYLPKDFLVRIMADAGYHNWQDLIVSSTCRKTKASGKIWSIRELEGKNILHIGDSRHSDVITPRKYGIETVHYTRAHCQPRAGCQLSPAVLPFSASHRYAEMVLRANPAFAQAPDYDSQRMYALGQSFGVVIVGAFTLWLMQRAQKNNITHLAFCARDGWLMRKAWHILSQESASGMSDSYLYVSRKVLTLGAGYLTCKPEKLSPVMLDFLAQATHLTTMATILERLKELEPTVYADAKKIFTTPDAYVLRHDNHRKLKDFLCGHSHRLYEVFRQCNEQIVGYFTQEKLYGHKRLGIVDMGWNGTMQSNIRQLCRQITPDFSCMGFYYGLWKTASGNRYMTGPMESAFFSEFDRSDEMRKNTQGVDIIEELHSASGGSTSGFRYESGQWLPVTKETQQERAQFENLISPFHKGVLDGLNELVTYGRTQSGLQHSDLTTQNALHAYRLLFLSPTTDEINVLSKIAHSALFDHNLTGEHDINIPAIPQNYRHVMWNCAWTVGLLRQWLVQASPSQKEVIHELLEEQLGFLGKRERRQFNMG